MKFAKKFTVAAALVLAGSFVFAQTQTVQKKSSSNSSSETSVENEYLNDVDGEIIMGLATSDDLDNKLVALQFLQDALEAGNTSDAVLQALDQLAGDGVLSESREAGRKINNFPQIRRQACLLMAKVPTEHSKNTLVKIAIADNEPMVIAAAVNSLGAIGINDNDEVINAIAYANKRNQYLNPTSSLAMEVLDAYEKLGPNTENIKTIIESTAEIARDYHYVTPVRQRASRLLKTLSKGSSSNSGDAK